MKRKIISLAVTLLMMLTMLPAAYAEVLCNMGSCTAGMEINYLIGDLPIDAMVTPEALPYGCELAMEPEGSGSRLYLRGTPMYAGTEMFELAVEGSEIYSILCSLDVQPFSPELTVSGDVTCSPGESVTVSVGANIRDGGSLSYQWYYDNGQTVPGATEYFYAPDTSRAGVSRFFCQVTNNNNGRVSAVNSATVTVTVSEPVVKRISMASLPEKLQYHQGDSLDATGLTILVFYADGSTAVMTDGFTLSPTQLTAEGTQTVQVSYQGQKCSFQVSVANSSELIEGIGVVTLPKKTSYIQGEKLETAGLSIRVYTDKGQYDVSSDLNCSPAYLDQAGSQTVTVTYGGKTCTFKVAVEPEEETVLGISVVQKPTLLEYNKGDRLDPSGLIVKLTTNKGSENITTGFSCTPKVLTTVGVQEITVVYGLQTCKFSVNVKDGEQASPSPSPSPVASSTPKPSPSASPGYTPSRHESHETGAGNALVKVILVVSVLALAGLAAYVYFMRRRGQR